jgi:hypothetical protein
METSVSRFPQKMGTRGSQKWIQLAVNQPVPRYLDGLIVPHLERVENITWCSPLVADDFAEYRDEAFLDQIKLGGMKAALKDFWPARGPQWDALAVTNSSDVLIVEAKAHIDEVFSPASAAGDASMQKIKSALSQTAVAMGAKPLSPWETTFYQPANRLAHLHFLRQHGVKAWLVLVNFIGDHDMQGPMTREEWEAAYTVVWHVLGVSDRQPLFAYVIHCYPQVSELAAQ